MFPHTSIRPRIRRSAAPLATAVAGTGFLVLTLAGCGSNGSSPTSSSSSPMTTHSMMTSPSMMASPSPMMSHPMAATSSGAPMMGGSMSASASAMH